MKKIFTLAAALFVMGSVSFAQDSKMDNKDMKTTKMKKTEMKSDKMNPKTGKKVSKSTKMTETKTETK